MKVACNKYKLLDALTLDEPALGLTQPYHRGKTVKDPEGGHGATVESLAHEEAGKKRAPGLVQHALRQFVAKIVVKDGAGTLYYTFPLDSEISSESVVDLREYLDAPRQASFAMPGLKPGRKWRSKLSTEQLKQEVHRLYESALSYRQIADVVDLHFSRVYQILKGK